MPTSYLRHPSAILLAIVFFAPLARAAKDEPFDRSFPARHVIVPAA